MGRLLLGRTPCAALFAGPGSPYEVLGFGDAPSVVLMRSLRARAAVWEVAVRAKRSAAPISTLGATVSAVVESDPMPNAIVFA